MKKGLLHTNLKFQNRILKLIIVILVSAFTFYSFMGTSGNEKAEVKSNLHHTTFNLHDAAELTKNYRAATTNQAYAFQISRLSIERLGDLIEYNDEIGGFRCYYGLADNGGNYYLIYRGLNSFGSEIPRSDTFKYQALTIPSDYGPSTDGFPYAFPCPEFCDRDNGSETDRYKFTNNFED